MRINLQGMTSLTQAHSPQIELMISRMHGLSEFQIMERMLKASKNLYTDDAPGLRGESQLEYAACRALLTYRWSA